MAEQFKIGIEHARLSKAMVLLSASIIGGCLVITSSAFARVIDVPSKTVNAPVQPAKTSTNDAAQLKDLQQKLDAMQNQLSHTSWGTALEKGI